MPIFALWNGGPSYADGNLDTDLETFPTIKAAGEALWRRETDGGTWQQTFTYADGRVETTFTPGASESSMTLYLGGDDPRESTDPYPDRILSIGPRGGIRSERC